MLSNVLYGVLTVVFIVLMVVGMKKDWSLRTTLLLICLYCFGQFLIFWLVDGLSIGKALFESMGTMAFAIIAGVVVIIVALVKNRK
ncbi:hypothetical protein [Staphylococcus massiliensis]|uniref:Uncharacterized protein n=1 Tax=Staphylococcus massiliensis S46 TaxID=1229783 RepID=K9AFC8_9STAP|nr:hypothetical protein [Staphylococcus massiliensis]EKU46034.1 hypothetical protein C273_10247 [Staphylococcus massiliensis S46]MCG3400302.1 hypothetical protein [Staphylococcus massiliensis]MCG3401932.1 hypothetical protein [Staphylococcus massiliensis]MCG3412406.1 hypothetical protein [Staphylococcus massiliensis]POA01438.1 hypothetical protein CD133_01905 [Staphylococcus massiliensis CCUG 55927]